MLKFAATFLLYLTTFSIKQTVQSNVIVRQGIVNGNGHASRRQWLKLRGLSLKKHSPI